MCLLFTGLNSILKHSGTTCTTCFIIQILWISSTVHVFVCFRKQHSFPWITLTDNGYRVCILCARYWTCIITWTSCLEVLITLHSYKVRERDCNAFKGWLMFSANYLNDFRKQSPSYEGNSQSATQILHFFGTWSFITLFVTVHRGTLSRPRGVQSKSSHPISPRYILTLSSHLCLGIPRDLLPSCYPIYNVCATCHTHLRVLNVCWSTDLCGKVLWILLWLTAFSGSFSMRSQSTDGPSSCKKRSNSCANPSRSFLTVGCLASGTVPSSLFSSCCSWICASRFVSSLNSREPDGALWCPRTCNNQSHS